MTSPRRFPFDFDEPIEIPVAPWQRLSAALHATGTPIHSIVTHVNKTLPEISEFITSAKGQEIIREVLYENQARLYDLLDAAGIDSLLTLIKIRDGQMSKSTEKIAACKELLSRTLPNVKARESKPKEGSGAGAVDVQDEISRLEKSITQV
jgi:hypothetical protein